MTKRQLEKFMIESNAMEGEKGLNPGDLEAIKYVMEFTAYAFDSLDDILAIHKMLTSHLDVRWSGKLRRVEVSVGSYRPPHHVRLPSLMAYYVERLSGMNSFEAHNEFELIHPFQDFNGRMGRLIWLSKALEEGYDLSIPFLQKYYYQTLKYLEGPSGY